MNSLLQQCRPKTSLAVLVTHPIQYFAPWFRELARREEVDLTVYYCLQPNPQVQGEGFNVSFQWDVPLLEGYRHRFLANTAPHPGVTYKGCDNREVDELVAAGLHDVWLVHGWFVKSYWRVIRACWRAKVPCMVRGDSTLLDRRSWPLRLVKRLMLGRWIPRFAAYLTVGSLNAAYYEHYGADPRRFHRVPHCVDNERFAACAQTFSAARLGLRRKWGVPNNAVTFAFCGKFIEKKRPVDLLLGLERLLTLRRVHGLMIGDGPLRAELEWHVKDRRLPVTFSGFKNQSELPEMYALADVLVVPSGHDETWGLVVNEAMACGVPAVVSDRVGCGPDLVLEGRTGQRYAAGRIDDLVEKLERYVLDPAMIRTQGEAARQHVHLNFNLTAAVTGTIEASRFACTRIHGVTRREFSPK